MSLTVTSGIPARLTIGDAYAFNYGCSVYSAPDWDATLVIRDSEGNVVSFIGADDGSNHSFSLANADTSKLKAGLGTAVVTFSDGTNRQSSYPYSIWIDPDPTKAILPTEAEKIVNEIEAAILKLSGTTETSVSFNGQSFTKRDLGAMNQMLTYWKARVIREAAAAQISDCCGYRPAKCGGKVPWSA